jgi:hypothetical protein
MLLGITLAALAAACGRGQLAGAALALACAAKPQAVLWLPIVVILLLWMQPQPRSAGVRLLAAFAAGIGILVALELLRSPQQPWWTIAAAHNPFTGPAEDVWRERLGRWLELLRTAFGPPTLLLLVIVALMGIRQLLVRRYQPRDGRRRIGLDWFWIACVAGLSAVLVTIGPLFDRYTLLVLVPLVLVCARATVWLYQVLRLWLIRGEVDVAFGAVALVIVGAAFAAPQGELGIEDPQTSFPTTPGIEQVADYLNAQHVAAVVYDHWLGWQLRFYLGEWSSVRLVYYPEPAALVRDAVRLNERETRYFPVPAQQAHGAWLAALEAAGFRTVIALRLPHYLVYAISPPAAAARGRSGVALHPPPDLKHLLHHRYQIVGHIGLGQVTVRPGLQRLTDLIRIDQC